MTLAWINVALARCPHRVGRALNEEGGDGWSDPISSPINTFNQENL